MNLDTRPDEMVTWGNRDGDRAAPHRAPRVRSSLLLLRQSCIGGACRAGRAFRGSGSRDAHRGGGGSGGVTAAECCPEQGFRVDGALPQGCASLVTNAPHFFVFWVNFLKSLKTGPRASSRVLRVPNRYVGHTCVVLIYTPAPHHPPPCCFFSDPPSFGSSADDDD